MSIPSQDELLSKKDQLENIKEILKQEFMGIDDNIEKIVDYISSWYLIPSMQNRPLVVNLWGMTGVGKTALVKRLAELIKFGNRLYHFDIGESKSWEYKAKHSFRELGSQLSNVPFICCFDDFQFARTKTPDGREMNKPNTRFIWELMDSGILNLDTDRVGLATMFKKKIDDLKRCLEEGVVVENGKVIQNKNLYLNILTSSKRNLFGSNLRPDPETGDLNFVPQRMLLDIKNLGNQSVEFNFQLERKIEQLNGPETVNLLEEIFNKALSQERIDCTKALIFVVGNLDEAFSMSGDINPDISADRFHKDSLKINISNIKHTLRCYFRQEQVARLGNNHVIYPAFDENTYRKIIDLELNKVSEKLQEEAGVPISFHDSVKQFLYDEGVYPTLGTRPLLSTINSYITSKLGHIVSKLIPFEDNVAEIHVTHKEQLIFRFVNARNKILGRKKFVTAGALSEAREPKQENDQALNAVHESGHAILSISLINSIPTMVCSVTADASSLGFTHLNFSKDRISEKEMIPRAAVGLGGHLAEKLVFGAENVHSGCDEDIKRVTELVSKLIKKEGMGPDLLNVNVPDFRKNFTYHDIDGRFNDQVFAIAEQAEKLAEKTLKAEIDKLLILADYLSDNAKIDKKGIIKLLGIGRMAKNEQPFRKQLKEKVEKIKIEKKNVA